MKRILWIVVLLAVLVVLVGPAGAGFWATGRVNTLMDQMERGGDVRFQVIKTERGWFSTTMEMTMELTGEPKQAFLELRRESGVANPEPLQLRWRSRVYHGPIPFSGGSFKPAIAYVETELVGYPGDDKLKPEDIPLDIRTHLGLFGGGTTTVRVSEINKRMEEDNLRIEWEGVSAEFVYGRDFRTTNTDFDMPRLEVEDDEVAMLVEGVEVRSSQHKGQGGLSLGDTTIRLGAVDILPKQTPEDHFALDTAYLALRAGSSDPETVEASMEFHFDELEAGGMKFGPGGYVLELRNLDAKSLIKIQETVEELQGKDLPEQQRNMMLGATFFGLMPELLKRGPVIELSELTLESEYGTLRGQGRITVDTSNEAVLSNPLLLSDALIASLELEIPESLLVAITARELKAEMTDLELDYSDEQLQSMARVRVQNRMAEAKNLFVLEDGVYRMEANIEGGSVMVNGKQVKLLNALQ